MLRMKATNSVLTLLLLTACGGDDSSDGGHATDADPDAPDADPDAPDAGPRSAQIFDHHHIDVDSISSGCLDQLKSGDFVFHYAHRSHGSQITVGGESLEESNPDIALAESYCSVPDEADALWMWDGMTPETGNLIPQEDYWDSEAGLDELRGILEDNPEIKYTMWAWSFEINEQTDQSIDDYLDAIGMLEDEFPAVRFIYMTGPAATDDFMAQNNADRNAQIRDFAQANDKLLYDFEELDTYSGGENHSQDGIPWEHPDFDLSEGESEFEFTHTNEASAVQKARAFWGMMAALECGS
jgi:hypothetical protein